MPLRAKVSLLCPPSGLTTTNDIPGGAIGVGQTRELLLPVQNIPCTAGQQTLQPFTCKDVVRGEEAPINFQFCRSLLAWIGIPGNALNVDEAQKNVSFQSGT